MRFIQIVLLSLLLLSGPALAQGGPVMSSGQVLYLPVYSSVWHGETDRKGQPTKSLVSVLVSVRNADMSKPIQVVSAQYFDTDGRKVKEYVAAPKPIAPMGTYELFVPRSDDTGGSGANFVIAWKSDGPVNAPVVEAVHVSMTSGRSIAFTTSAREITPSRK